MSWKDRLADWIEKECERKDISGRQLAVRISNKSKESVSFASIQAWLGKQSNGLAPKSRKALAKYRGWTVAELQVWLDEGKEPAPIVTPQLCEIEQFLRTASADEAAHITSIASQRVVEVLGEKNGNGKVNGLIKDRLVSHPPNPIAKAITEWQQAKQHSDEQLEIYADDAGLTPESFRELKAGRAPTAEELKKLARIILKPNGKAFPLEELRALASNGADKPR